MLGEEVGRWSACQDAAVTEWARRTLSRWRYLGPGGGLSCVLSMEGRKETDDSVPVGTGRAFGVPSTKPVSPAGTQGGDGWCMREVGDTVRRALVHESRRRLPTLGSRSLSLSSTNIVAMPLGRWTVCRRSTRVTVVQSVVVAPVSGSFSFGRLWRPSPIRVVDRRTKWLNVGRRRAGRAWSAPAPDLRGYPPRHVQHDEKSGMHVGGVPEKRNRRPGGRPSLGAPVSPTRSIRRRGGEAHPVSYTAISSTNEASEAPIRTPSSPHPAAPAGDRRGGSH